MKKSALILVALLVSACVGLPIAQAAQVERTLSWNAPTTYTSGAPLPASAVTGYRVLYSIDDTSMADSFVVSGTTLDRVIKLDLPPRAEPYVIYAAVRTITADAESANSTVANFEFSVPLGEPQPPTEVRFVID